PTQPRISTVVTRPTVTATDIAARRQTPAPQPIDRGADQDLSDMEIPTFIRRQMD
ncbi:MAG: hypothetical protein K0S86_3400, partial [Geminicoccaceae bacterium]|nr:hypothetical protein [Geminicoccaceae bacterium]